MHFAAEHCFGCAWLCGWIWFSCCSQNIHY